LKQLLLFLLITAFIVALACAENSNEKKALVFEKAKEIEEIKPQKPIRIKLKRSTTGKYSWDLSGDDPDKVLEVDRRLKEALSEGK
jgi:hypothetical protein